MQAFIRRIQTNNVLYRALVVKRTHFTQPIIFNPSSPTVISSINSNKPNVELELRNLEKDIEQLKEKLDKEKQHLGSLVAKRDALLYKS